MVVDKRENKNVWEKVKSRDSFAAGVDTENQATLEETLKIAETALTGFCYQKGRVKKSNEFHEWFGWVQSDDTRAILWWHWVSKNKKTNETGERDEYVLELWHSVDDENAPNKDAKKEVNESITHWSYYQSHFFNWFLNRYHIRFAREVLTKNCFICSFHYWYFVLNLFIVLFYYIKPNLFTYEYVSGFILLSAIPILILYMTHKLSDLKIGNFIHSMVPRLSATITIGYLFLISIPDFIRKVYQEINEYWLLFAGVSLILLVFLFILLNIHKRVKPDLSFKNLISRAVDIFILSISYSLSGLYILEPVIRKSVFTNDQLALLHPCFSQLFFIASVSLAIGVILQLIWEEKPVTEPL